MVDRTVMQSGRYKAYPEYKDSGVEWLGEIPSAWSLLKLKRVIREHSGNGFPIELQKDVNGVIPFLKVSDISGKEKYIDSPANFVSLENIRRYRWNMVPKGSIVTGKIGEALRKNHRKILLVDSVIDNNCIGIEPTKILSDFNFYAHNLIDFDWYVNPGAVPSISVQKYKKEYLAIPSLNEQEKIISFLDHETAKIDTLIEKQQRLIELLIEKRQAVISHAVTKGLNADVPMKDSGVEWLGEVPSSWRHTYLSIVADVIDPQPDHRAPAISEDGEGFPYIGIRDVKKDGTLNFETARPVNESAVLKQEKSFSIDAEDIIFCKVGTLGLPRKIRPHGRCALSATLVLIKPKLLVDSQFLLYVLDSDSVISQTNLLATGSTRAALGIQQIRRFKIPYPKLDEQKKIANFLDNEVAKIDSLIEMGDKQIQLMQERRTALISAAVTGKIDVRDWVKPE